MVEIEEIVRGIFDGNRRWIAKAITIVESDNEQAQELVSKIFPRTGNAHVIGLTGSGGAGKSTLIEKIVKEYRQMSKTLGVVAVDPTSPFSGGAFLGDRIRMQELCMDENVFIRSMATRNFAGGIAKATKDAVQILDASGKDVIIVETVGAGQSEVEIIKVAQTVIVVQAPGLGDEIQAIKAGIMEIADIFVVNKADRENANKTVSDIQANLQLSSKENAWRPPILKTIATTGEGVSELVKKIEEHRCFLKENVECKRTQLRNSAEMELIEAIKEKIADSLIEKLKSDGKLDLFLEEIQKKKLDPKTAAERVLKDVLHDD